MNLLHKRCKVFRAFKDLSTLSVSFFVLFFIFFIYIFIADNIFNLDVHYVCYTMRVQRFEPQGRRFTNFHYYYHYYKVDNV